VTVPERLADTWAQADAATRTKAIKHRMLETAVTDELSFIAKVPIQF